MFFLQHSFQVTHFNLFPMRKRDVFLCASRLVMFLTLPYQHSSSCQIKMIGGERGCCISCFPLLSHHSPGTACNNSNSDSDPNSNIFLVVLNFSYPQDQRHCHLPNPHPNLSASKNVWEVLLSFIHHPNKRLWSYFKQNQNKVPSILPPTSNPEGPYIEE